MSDQLSFGRLLVPHGFEAIPVLLPRRAFVWGGFLHAFDGDRGAYVPVAIAVRRAPSVWLPGPATERLVALLEEDAFAAVDGFTDTDEFTEAS